MMTGKPNFTARIAHLLIFPPPGRM